MSSLSTIHYTTMLQHNASRFSTSRYTSNFNIKRQDFQLRSILAKLHELSHMYTVACIYNHKHTCTHTHTCASTRTPQELNITCQYFQRHTTPTTSNINHLEFQLRYHSSAYMHTRARSPSSARTGTHTNLRM